MMNAKPTITTTDWTRNDGAQSTLKQPTLNELLAITFEERRIQPSSSAYLAMYGWVRGTVARGLLHRICPLLGGKADMASGPRDVRL
jgi:hypothetical protein